MIDSMRTSCLLQTLYQHRRIREVPVKTGPRKYGPYLFDKGVGYAGMTMYVNLGGSYIFTHKDLTYEGK